MTEQKITDYFGFDLGDGESAVCWASANSKTEPQLIEIAGKKSVLSAIGEHEDLGTLIGEQAYLADAGNLHVRFKSGYLTDPERSGVLIRRFAKAVLDELMKSGKLNDPDAAAFFVGCPSGWSDRARADYAQIFKQAGLKNVEVVSESRAAFLFVRESGELNLPDATLARPTLIIDSGSSTTDYTFINELKTVRAFDFGETHLGGGLIDQMLLDLNIARSPIADKLKLIFERSPQYRARCELEARKVKEMYFRRRAQTMGARFSVPCESSVKIYYEKPPLTLDISCDDDDMEKVLSTPIANGRSYTQIYRAGLQSAKSMLKDMPPEQILMTGGASRMDFIAEIAREVFPDARILFGAEPEFSIARGLCYALRIDQKTLHFEGGVRTLTESDELARVVRGALPRLFYGISPVIVDALIEDCALPAFADWKAGDIKTLQQMSESIKNRLAQILASDETKKLLTPAVGEWLEGIRPELETLTDPICTEYGLPLTSLRLPSAIGMDDVQINLQPTDLMNFSTIQTIVDVSIAAIVGGLLGGGGIALLMAGPIGFILSFAIGFVASRLGTSYAKKHIDQAELPSFLRALFTKNAFRRQLDGKRDALEHQLADQLIATIDPPSDQTLQLIHTILGAIEDQMHKLAERARLLIH